MGFDVFLFSGLLCGCCQRRSWMPQRKTLFRLVVDGANVGQLLVESLVMMTPHNTSFLVIQADKFGWEVASVDCPHLVCCRLGCNCLGTGAASALSISSCLFLFAKGKTACFYIPSMGLHLSSTFVSVHWESSFSRSTCPRGCHVPLLPSREICFGLGSLMPHGLEIPQVACSWQKSWTKLRLVN